MISQTTPDGLRPARRARSTAASVCPIRWRTPPGFARSGKMWPRLHQIVRLESGLIATWTVWLRSAAEMPGRDPLAGLDRSGERGAERRTRCGRSSGGKPSWSARSSVRQRQISPRACVAMKLIASGVANWAAIDEVAFVLAVGIVDDDDDAPFTDLLDCLLDGGERSRRLPSDQATRR